MVLGVCLLGVVGACGPRPAREPHPSTASAHVPPDVAGEIPITVINEGAAPVCELRLTPKNGRRGESWLKGDLARDTSVSMKIRPGTYGVEAAGCNNQLSGGKALSIHAPLTIHVGADGKPPAGSVNLPLRSASRAPPAHGGAGRAQEAQHGEDECVLGMCGGDFGQCCEGWHCAQKPGSSAQLCEIDR
ncbi:MAG: hypothetical protein JWO86_7588 [Myxococcaceae bacterium]|nr:hypothetical protein [Myxococcaceae bacterium]